MAKCPSRLQFSMHQNTDFRVRFIFSGAHLSQTTLLSNAPIIGELQASYWGIGPLSFMAVEKALARSNFHGQKTVSRLDICDRLIYLHVGLSESQRQITQCDTYSNGRSTTTIIDCV